MSKPLVAIVGRQNVGKSTLLNRLAGKRLAIVDDVPGTTRDRILADVSYGGQTFTMIDTGGLELDHTATLAREINEQVAAAVADADVIIFLVGVTDGVVTADEEIAGWLRRAEKPVLLVANKADNDKLETAAVDFYQLGMGEPLPVSAYHDRGISELLARLLPLLPDRHHPPGTHRSDTGRHCGAAQRGQVHPAQYHHRRGAGHRQRPAGHHPRCRGYPG